MIDIASITGAERQELLGELLRYAVGAVPVSDSSYDWVVPLTSRGYGSSDAGIIRPQTTITITASPQIHIRLLRLVILPTETLVGGNDKRWHVLADYAAQLGLSMPTVVSGIVSRAAWLVRSIFVGNRLLLPGEGVGGDVFAPDGELVFDEVCESALSISLIVENIGVSPAQFLAVFLGRSVEVEKAHRMSRRSSSVRRRR